MFLLQVLLAILFLSAEAPPSSINCPAGSALRNFGLVVECCSLYKSKSSDCHNEGPTEYTWRQDSSTIALKKMNYLDDQLHGDFIWYRGGTNNVKMSGSYKFDIPSGVWKIFDSKGEQYYEVRYDRAALSTIHVPNGKNPKTILNITPAKTFEFASTRVIAHMTAKGIGVELADRPMPFTHLLFYSSPSKKEIVGAVIGDTVFVYNILNTRTEQTYGNAFDWFVYKVDGNMCLVRVSDYETWVECTNYQNIVEWYKNSAPSIKRTETVHDSPNNAGKALGPVTCVSDPFRDEDDVRVDIVESKVVNGDTWVKIKTPPNCTIEGRKTDMHWIPFYDKNKIRLRYNLSGC